MVGKTSVIIIIIVASSIVVAGVVTGVVLATKKSGAHVSKINKAKDLTTLLKDKDFIKPNRRLNAEYELVKLNNGMTGLLINDPFAEKFHVQLSIPFGSYVDTVEGISHFGEHMVLQGSEKYPSLFPVFNKFEGIEESNINAMTSGDSQVYYITLPFNYEYEKAIDYLSDAFRYPLYKPDIIKNEIQAVNHEFYDGINGFERIFFNIVKQLSNKDTSYNRIGSGNNETLKVEESELLSEILKGHHMLIKNPKNIFFTLYSNKSINELEDYAKKYLNYDLHKFTDYEIDIEDQKNLEDNIKNLKNKKIFDENTNTFKHGFFFNSNKEKNILIIFYYIGEIDTKQLKFDLVSYIDYLLNSESLIQILNNNSYIIDQRIETNKFDNLLQYNNLFSIGISLTEDGLENINDILIIINKYVEMIKKEGYKKEYYNNYANFINSQDILEFNKASFSKLEDNILKIFYNYYSYENNEILLTGTLSENDYNQELLQKYLNQIKYEQSFYGVNTKKNIKDLDLDSIIKNKETQKLKYFKRDFILGTIPDEISEKINDENHVIEDLEFRKINPYLSEKYREKVIPCYKEETNKCSEKNEFDYEKEEKYKGTKLEDNDIYETYYQIDKSSESHLVYSNINLNFTAMPDLDSNNISFFENYLKMKSSKFTENSNMIQIVFSSFIGILKFSFKTFSDNTEKIINNFLSSIKEEISDEDFESLKKLVIKELYPTEDKDFSDYVMKVFQAFKESGFEDDDTDTDMDTKIEEIKDLKKDDFQPLIEEILNSIKSIKFKIAGNIDKSLVQNIHNNIKKNFNITKTYDKLKQSVPKDDSPYVYNYYQISTFDSPENGIIVNYNVPDNYSQLFNIFGKCFVNIAFNHLRFNYMNTYTPMSQYDGSSFIIYEQGLFKDVDEMEDDINKVLLDIINKKITIDNYKDIIESLNLESTNEKEKTFESLFEYFVLDEPDFDFGSLNNVNEDKKNEYPNSFEELVELIAPVFTNPQRITILIAKKDTSEENFEKMFERRSQNKKYFLNEDIEVKHTKDITYLDN